MKTVAVIPGGGSGRRMEGAVPKQYLLLDGTPILIHTLKIFHESPYIDEIFLIVPPDDVAVVRSMLENECRISKVSRVLAGGRERQDSVRNGLRMVDDNHDIVVIHDAVRPFITGDLIRLAVEGARVAGAVAIGMTAKDTVKRAGGDDLVSETLNRDSIWLVQTPQAFQRQVIKKAYEKAYEDNFIGTDDAVLVERMGVPVKMIPGSSDNIKITTQNDLLIGEALMRKKGGEKLMHTGFGYDSHRLVGDRALILGGVKVPYEKGLLGHSDADVLLHAIGDALIGAIGAGDIGAFFPDTDPAYKNISSLKLLDRIAVLVKERGFSVNNLDATVVMEEPRMREYVESMVLNISRSLAIPSEQINIKAKTNEGMGFVGRKEGIAAFAVVTVNKRGTP
ncbi:MAG: 2-C-methyl-D-erythritol 4-phosphate cytidylyltransferase [Deltaproteobacteria bacterium]|nr:2-C-methyl-D-erythritol 4-phosphate cytidylyltransferase [Deltaproteobacteria bacterium]